VATYNFETVTPDQAQAITAADRVIFTGGPARTVGVVYQSYDPLSLTPELPRIVVTYEGRTVSFGTDLARLTETGGLQMSDGSRLAIGDAAGNLIEGRAGHDGLYGGPDGDTLQGGAGDDMLQGNGGDDMLSGGDGANTLYGGRGDDTIYASGLPGTSGAWAHGNQGDDLIAGGAGDDTLYGGQGDDFIGGKDGNDWLSGDLGDDEIHAGAGNDTANGGAGNDHLYSTDGSDLLLGGDGDDMVVVYGFGATLAHGGAGADTLVSASADQSVLYGGEGRDHFEMVTKGRPGEGFDDIIADWEAGDRISFPQVSIHSILPRQYSEFTAVDYDAAYAIAQQHITFTGAQYAVAQVDDDVIVFADSNGDSSDGADIAVLLVGASLSDISYANFI
jgi:Ca2+-binding RTX toxin-like protein